MAPSKPNLKPVKADATDLAAGQRVLNQASEALSALAAALDGEFVRALDLLAAVQDAGKAGRIIVSGMGKSGHIARKIAATLSSTGSPAYFVHPAEASHGDLGAVTRDDVLIMLSWGGETAELSHLITHARRFRIPLIGIASTPDSTLMQAADVRLVLPRAPEACTMGLAPTTSTTMMLSLGDALAVALMERKGFSPDQYRDFHPGGSLGRALIRVSDLMHTGAQLPLVREDAAMADVLLTMASGRMGCVGVVDAKGGLVGIVTDGDVRRHFGSDLKTAAEVMTSGPKVAPPGQLAAEALGLMNEKKITQLFVLAPDDPARIPLGILHIHDCLDAGLS